MPGPVRRGSRGRARPGRVDDQLPDLVVDGGELVDLGVGAALGGDAGDGSFHAAETHHNLLIDTARVPALLAAEGVQVTVASAFGTEQLPTGLCVLIGRRAA